MSLDEHKAMAAQHLREVLEGSDDAAEALKAYAAIIAGLLSAATSAPEAAAIYENIAGRLWGAAAAARGA